MNDAHCVVWCESPLPPHGEFGLGAPTTTATTMPQQPQPAETTSAGRKKKKNRTSNANEFERFDSSLYPTHTHVSNSPHHALTLSLSVDGDCDVGSQHNTIYRCQSYRTHTHTHARQYQRRSRLVKAAEFAGGQGDTVTTKMRTVTRKCVYSGW